MFVNGQELAANGEPSISRELTRPQWRPQVATFRTDSRQVEILVHVANFSHIKGGMWEPVSLGPADQILRKRDLAIGANLFIFGSLFVMGFYHLSIFSLQRNDLSGLFLGLFCMVIAFRTLLTGEAFVATLAPQLSLELLAKLEYGSGSLAMASFLAFMTALFPDDFPRPLRGFVYACTIFSILTIAGLPLRYYARLLPPFQVLLAFVCVWSFIVVIKRAYRRQPGAGRLLIGSAILAATVLNDIAYANRMHTISGLSNTVPFGLLAFVLSQTLVVAERFSSALSTAEALTVELEDKVYQRTLELEEVNQKLQIAATKDALTMLNNRYNLQHSMEQDNLAYRRLADSAAYSLIYLDLDNFKQFNDAFGHDVGDFILQQFAHVLMEVLGGGEHVYRLGGDEFAILLPDQDSEAAQQLAMALVRALDERRFPLDILEQALGISGTGYAPVTCSMGIATHVPGTVFDLGRMLQAADRMMLEGKKSRRH